MRRWRRRRRRPDESCVARTCEVLLSCEMAGRLCRVCKRVSALVERRTTSDNPSACVPCAGRAFRYLREHNNLVISLALAVIQPEYVFYIIYCIRVRAIRQCRKPDRAPLTCLLFLNETEWSTAYPKWHCKRREKSAIKNRIKQTNTGLYVLSRAYSRQVCKISCSACIGLGNAIHLSHCRY